MEDLPPIENLKPEAQQIIRISEMEMGLSYPVRQPSHAYQVRRRSVLREVMKLLIAMHLEAFDAISRQAVLTWLGFGQFEIPLGRDAIQKLQHDYVLQELYSRGFANYSAPTMMVKNIITKPDEVHLNGAAPSIILSGDNQQLLLLTTNTVYCFRITVHFTVNPSTGVDLHTVEFLMNHYVDHSDRSFCTSCGKSPIASPSDLVSPKPAKILLCNARGAANTSFPQYLADRYEQEQPEFIIVTETRVLGKAARRIRESMIFDHSVGVDASGFCGGCWMLWNERDSAIEVVSKGPFFLQAEFSHKNQD